MAGRAEAVLGVDGCPGGWIGALVQERSVTWLPLPDATAILAVGADSYLEANALSSRLAEKGLVRQTWNIVNRIAAVDAALGEPRCAASSEPTRWPSTRTSGCSCLSPVEHC